MTSREHGDTQNGDAAALRMDPVRFEVMRNAFTAAADEMAAALRKTAYSTNIKTRADFSCAIFDRNLNLLAQSFAQANHLGSLVRMGPLGVEAYGAENFNPGDGIVLNDPFLGGVHLKDITIISPVYSERTLRVRGQPGPSRRRWWRSAGKHRSLPGSLPGRRDHPSGPARRRLDDLRRRVPADLVTSPGQTGNGR